MFSRKKITRETIYRSVFLFTILYFLLIYFQKRILLGLFQTQLSFSIPNVIAILTSDNSLDVLTSRGTNGAIITGAFLVIEVLVFILLILLFLWKLWQLKKMNNFKKYDYLLVVGLIILLFGSFYYAFITASTSMETFNTVSRALNHLTPKQIQALIDKWQNFLYNYEFSLGYLPRDVSLVIGEAKHLIGNVKEISQVPDVINQWLNHLSLLKFHYFLVMCLGFITLLVAQVAEYQLIIKSFRKIKRNKKSSNSVSDNQLATILEEQQVLMEKIVDLQTDIHKNNQSIQRNRKYYRKR